MQPEPISDSRIAQVSEAAPARLALVIGNAHYDRAGRLPTAAADARAVADRLIEVGFTVRAEFDLGSEQLAGVVESFLAELAQATSARAQSQQTTTALFYFSGYAVQVLGGNYLLPVDGVFDTVSDVKQRALALDWLIGQLRKIALASVVLLDCCRPNPMHALLGPDGQSRTLAVHQGLAEVAPPRGVVVAYATQPDTVALDAGGRHSPFSAALVKYLDLPDVSVTEMLSQVRRQVSGGTGGRQLPWDRSGLVHPLILRPVRCAKQVPLEQMLADEQAEACRAFEYWTLIERTPNPDLLRSFLHQFPRSPHRPEAVARLDALRWEGVRNGFVQRVAAVLVCALLAVVSWFGIEYARFSDGDGQLANAVIVGDDIEVPGLQSRPTGIAGCRMRCILNMQCTAITWTPESAGLGAPRSTGTCSLKLAANYVARAATVRHVASPRSEVMRRRGAVPPQMLAEGARHVVDRTLDGELVPPDRVARRGILLDPDGRNALRKDPSDGKIHWRVTSAACHQRCEDLGGDCKGFSYTPLGQRCLLFGKVKGVVRGSEGAEVVTPSVHSVCYDMTVADCRGSR